MANVDAAYGAKPFAYLSGAPWNGQVRRYVVLAANTTAVGIGDFVVLDSEDSDTYPQYAAVLAATASSEAIVGVAVGFEANPANLNIEGRYRSASATTKDRIVMVVDDPDVLFTMNADGAVSADLIGSLGNPTYTTPNTTTGVSTMELDASEFGTDVNDQLRLMGFVDSPDNDTTLIGAECIVKINHHAYAPGRVSAAV